MELWLFLLLSCFFLTAGAFLFAPRHLVFVVFMFMNWVPPDNKCRANDRIRLEHSPNAPAAHQPGEGFPDWPDGGSLAWSSDQGLRL